MRCVGGRKITFPGGPNARSKRPEERILLIANEHRKGACDAAVGPPGDVRCGFQRIGWVRPLAAAALVALSLSAQAQPGKTQIMYYNPRLEIKLSKEYHERRLAWPVLRVGI